MRVTTKFKAKVHAQFDAALQHLDELGREPNWREEEGLFRALSFMKRGSYKLAEAELLAQADGLECPVFNGVVEPTLLDLQQSAYVVRGEKVEVPVGGLRRN